MLPFIQVAIHVLGVDSSSRPWWSRAAVREHSHGGHHGQQEPQCTTVSGYRGVPGNHHWECAGWKWGHQDQNHRWRHSGESQISFIRVSAHFPWENAMPKCHFFHCCSKKKLKCSISSLFFLNDFRHFCHNLVILQDFHDQCADTLSFYLYRFMACQLICNIDLHQNSWCWGFFHQLPCQLCIFHQDFQ